MLCVSFELFSGLLATFLPCLSSFISLSLCYVFVFQNSGFRFLFRSLGLVFFSRGREMETDVEWWNRMLSDETGGEDEVELEMGGR